MKNKKVMISIISVVALLLLLIGITYAYWLVTKTQTNSNIISSACLDITLDNETNDINLTSQYPMSDEDGMKLTPYTFTVTNNCNTSVDYQVALESIGEEATAIKTSAIKVALDNNVILLTYGGNVETTINGAYEANKLMYGTLAATGNEDSSVTHSLRMWIDENAPISEMNKTFQSKISVTIGQGIKNPYQEGTMAYDILANNNEPTTLSTKWIETASSDETHSMVSKTANYWYGTEYTLDTETGKYQLSGTLVQATLEECRAGTKVCGEYTLKNATQDYKYTTLYKITSFTNANQLDTTSWLYMTVQTMKSQNSFSLPATESAAGIYRTLDDLGESYYYRGNVANNYVQFGAYETDYKVYTLSDESACWNDSCVYVSIEECKNYAHYDYDPQEVNCVETISEDAEVPMYWRIVRINGDGTIRLVYDGTEKVENGISHRAKIGISTYNTEDNLNENYGDSDVKEVVDTWYKTHLKTNYGSYIADGIFCNDKEIAKVYYYDEDEQLTTEENAYYIGVDYAPGIRLANKKAPILTCTRKEDRYTTKESLGNGLLTHPVGLLTADEIFFAGGTEYVDNDKYYLYSGVGFWTSTSLGSYGIGGVDADAWCVNDDGSISIAGIGADYGVRPVINLRADVKFTGNGSFETPYVITVK